MSIAEFTPIIRTKINTKFKDKIDLSKLAQAGGFVGAGLSEASKQLRKELEKENESYDAIYSSNLMGSIFGNKDIIDAFYIYIQSKISDPEHNQTSYRDIEITKLYNKSPDPTFKIKNVTYSHVKSYIKDFINSSSFVADTSTKDTILENVDNFQIGHIVGLLSLRTANTFGTKFRNSQTKVLRTGGRETSVVRVNQHETDTLATAMDKIVQLLLDLDIATSNSLEHNLGFYANSLKSITDSSIRASLELQIDTGNNASGQIARALVSSIGVVDNSIKRKKKNLSFSAAPASTKGFASKLDEVLNKHLESIKKSLNNLGSEGLREVALKNLDSLVTMRSSDSIVESLEKIVVTGIKGTKFTSIKSSTGLVPIKTSKAKLSSTLPSTIKNLTTSLKSQSAKYKKKISVQIRSTQGQFISPVSIKNLINGKLAQQIQQNMGKGRATQKLNYRTGRFANSAEVVQITNRDGAITAFYSYQKNPYATFAPGGAQSYPESRDPNKLIQTSIRQIAQDIMINRLKVVPV